ncbi:sensor histidine kinase [Secundilactobacillus collinoides]|uniref:sensor histidine kinase n=1 Tax=Secundilactobacillus collinoides TaxID=33960 RepID=UPI001FB3738E|nr:HAMP domain-containing sensor histidine kinase [Secundilactobacillus collinoides]
MGHTELLLKHATDHPELVSDSVHYIEDEASQMQGLVTSLLELSRSDRAETQLTTIDLVPIVQTVIAQYADGQQVVAELPETLQLHANAGQVQQMLTALIDNARKYSDSSSTVTVRAAQTDDEHVVLTVADQGIGISDADKDKIFDRFYRADQSRSKRVAGYGIGLAIVKQLAALNEATVAVQDNKPTGSRFVLTFVREQKQV